MSCSHGGDYEDGSFPACCPTLPSRSSPMFQRYLPPSSLGWSHGTTTQKAAIFYLLSWQRNFVICTMDLEVLLLLYEIQQTGTSPPLRRLNTLRTILWSMSRPIKRFPVLELTVWILRDIFLLRTLNILFLFYFVALIISEENFKLWSLLWVIFWICYYVLDPAIYLRITFARHTQFVLVHKTPSFTPKFHRSILYYFVL
jgi:hypothetical protein